MAFEIFDQSDEETWPDQKNTITKTNTKKKTMTKTKTNIFRKHIQRDPTDLRPLRHLIRVMRGHDLTNKSTMTKTNTNTKTLTKTMIKTILETCDI